MTWNLVYGPNPKMEGCPSSFSVLYTDTYGERHDLNASGLQAYTPALARELIDVLYEQNAYDADVRDALRLELAQLTNWTAQPEVVKPEPLAKRDVSYRFMYYPKVGKYMAIAWNYDEGVLVSTCSYDTYTEAHKELREIAANYKLFLRYFDGEYVVENGMLNQVQSYKTALNGRLVPSSDR